ncbi:RNA polymerase sigma factor [Oleisolibacter albus]|uniref:RNA polymerase sigma factor n=1 Tax=Oleisolibacter albus TaxID=2171757 RepID=UPI000DF16B78|nr:RNA polymerase sigma factor [Oleisolibacter albus]
MFALNQTLEPNGFAPSVLSDPPVPAVAAEPGDDQLLARIAEGDRAAFARLARRHTPKALSVAQRILGSAAEADEVVQEAWIRVWTRAGTWRPDGTARFSTWLHRIVVNLCLDRRRRPAFAGMEEAPDLPDPSPDAPALLDQAQQARLVGEALRDLPDRQRAALSLCYYEDLSAAEAGRVLGLSVSAVESLLARARRALRARLGDLGLGRGEGGK